MTLTRRTFLVSAGSFVGAAASIGMAKHHIVEASATIQQAENSSAKVKLKRDTFAPLVNRSMTLHGPDGDSAQIRLAAVTPYNSESNLDQFTLQFTGAPSVKLPQGTYQIDVPKIGSVPLFLVPTNSESDRVSHYRANFALLA